MLQLDDFPRTVIEGYNPIMCVEPNRKCLSLAATCNGMPEKRNVKLGYGLSQAYKCHLRFNYTKTPNDVRPQINLDVIFVDKPFNAVLRDIVNAPKRKFMLAYFRRFRNKANLLENWNR